MAKLSSSCILVAVSVRLKTRGAMKKVRNVRGATPGVKRGFNRRVVPLVMHGAKNCVFECKSKQDRSYGNEVSREYMQSDQDVKGRREAQRGYERKVQ